MLHAFPLLPLTSRLKSLIFHVKIIAAFKIAFFLCPVQKQQIDKEAWSLIDYLIFSTCNALAQCYYQGDSLKQLRVGMDLGGKIYPLSGYGLVGKLSCHLLEGDFTN